MSIIPQKSVMMPITGGERTLVSGSTSSGLAVVSRAETSGT